MRFSSAPLTIAFVALVAACGDGTPGGEVGALGPGPEPSAPEPTPTVAVPLPEPPPAPTAAPEPATVAWFLQGSTPETGTSGQGGLFRSSDAGRTWDLAFPFRGDAFVAAPEDGWLAGDGTLYRTVDGWDSWWSLADAIPARAPRRLGPIAFFDGDEGIVFAIRPGTSLDRDLSILQTTDGGGSWFVRHRIESCPSGVHVCTTGRSAVAVGCEPRRLFRSDDAGATWVRVDLPFELPGLVRNPLSCNGASDFWIANEGRAAFSEDAGVTWRDQPLPPAADVLVSSVSFVNRDTGWAMGVGLAAGPGTVLLRTDDGGASWQEQARFEDDRSQALLQEVSFADGQHGVAVAQRLLPFDGPPFGPPPRRPVVYTTDDGGQSWTRRVHEDLPGQPFFLSIAGIGVPGGRAPAPTPAPAPMASEGRAFLSAREAGLFRSDDGGLRWRNVLTLPAGQHVFGLALLDRNLAFAVGDSGLILRTDDAGETWSTRHGPDQGRGFRATRLVTPRFFDRERGVIGGQGEPSAVGVSLTPVLLFTEDGGDTWQSASIDGLPEDPFGIYPKNVCVRPDGLAVAAHHYSVRYASGGGLDGAPRRLVLLSDDFGRTWTNVADEIDAPDNFFIRDVACPGDGHLWLLGGLQDEGTLPATPFALLSTDAGDTWRPVEIPLPDISSLGRSVSGSAFVSVEDGWVVAGPIGDHLVVLGTEDGGGRWRELLVSEEAVFSHTRVVRLDPDRAVVATSEQVGVLRQRPRVLLTEDAGATWTSVEFPDAPESRPFLDLAVVP